MGAFMLLAMLALPLGAGANEDDCDDYSCPMMGPGMMGGMGMMGSGMGMGGMGMMGPGMGDMGMMGHGDTGAMMHRHWMHALASLDLSDQQQKQIDQIRFKVRKDHWQTQGKMIDAQAQMRDAWASDTPDPKKVGAAFEAMAKLKREIIETDVAALNQIRQLLTDEQREKLKHWMRGHSMMEGGPGPMGPMHERMMR
jgi:Spy/CpxP family protein refolding chaperone